MRYYCLPGRDGYPWERARIHAEVFPEKIRDDLAIVLRTDSGKDFNRDHAYTATQLKRLRTLLKLDNITDECLNRHLDEFALYIGLQIRVEPLSSPKDRIANIRTKLVTPLQTLAKNLSGHGLRSEFLVQWGELRNFDLTKFEADIQALLDLARQQTTRHKRRSAKGREALSLIKDHHVELVDDLASYLQPDFTPTKRKAFEALVSLLAQPLFPKKTSFAAAVRKHIDTWRRAFDELRLKPR